MGQMPYRKFLAFSIAGGAIWVWSLVLAGHFLGGIPWVKEHLEIVILIVIFATVPIAILETMRERNRAKKEAAELAANAQPEG